LVSTALVPKVSHVATALPFASTVTAGSLSPALPSSAATADHPACVCVEPLVEPPPGDDGLEGEPGVVDVDDEPLVEDTSLPPPHADSATQAAMAIHAMGFIKVPF
jgi:hypothetical protein